MNEIPLWIFINTAFYGFIVVIGLVLLLLLQFYRIQSNNIPILADIKKPPLGEEVKND